MNAHASLTLQFYQDLAISTDQKRDTGSTLAFPLLGLFGETGSLLSEVKKKQRDAASYLGYAASVVEELGDVLWYLTTVAARAQLSIADIAHSLNRGLENWDHERAPDLEFASLQQQLSVPQDQPSPAFENTLLKLAGEVGLLMTDYQAGYLTTNRAALSGRLIAIFRALVHAATEAGVTLEQAAQENLAKIFDRWPLDKAYPTLFDADYPPEEQLPRSLSIEVLEREVAAKSYVFQSCNGVNIGDRLTDNIIKPDDYRFHDVFHYAYAAVLGWSPVTRSLLRLKRKSRPDIDEGQDGARATLVEEGIATWIFGQAKELDLFAGMKPRDLSFGLLKSVRRFVAGYEPERWPLWLWEEAIIDGYEAFRFLKENRRGRLRLDLNRRRLIVEELVA
jgi:NTP pyrophosphatase (non-canonical NTP hydrolase)